MRLAQSLLSFPTQRVATSRGVVSYRRAGSGPVLVLLHGIGSASASWLCQLQQLQATHCVLAWDAPGYGESSPLPMAQPAALDYGAQVWDWLDALGLDRGPLTLVGHSLGALMAAAAASLAPARVARLVLLSPAQGYGQASAELREGKLRDRLQALERLGAAGMARQRGAAMLSPVADASLVAFVQANMALIQPGGYTQAAHMLAGADLARELQGLRCPVLIASGSADTITPAVGCEALARRLACVYRTLGPVGHACALEAADAVNKILIYKETA